MPVRLSGQLIRNVLCSYLGYVTLLLGFFMFPFVVRHVGAEVYGIWLLTWAAVGYFELLDFGIGQSVARFVAECRAREDTDGLNRVCSSCFLFYTGASVVTLLATLLLARFFPHWFRVSPEHAAVASTLMLLAGVRLAVGLPLRVFAGVLGGIQRLDSATYIGVAAAVLTAILTVVVLVLGYGIVAVGVVTLAVGVLSDVAHYFAASRLLPGLRVALSLCSRETIAEVLRFSVWIFANRISVQLSYRTDALVIGFFLPKDRVTLYQVGLRLADLVREFPAKIAAAVFPTASYLSAGADSDRLRRLVLRGTRYGMVLYAPLAVFCLVEGDRLIECWMGSSRYGVSALVLRLLLVSGWAAVAQNVLAVTLQAAGDPRLPTWVGVFDALANLGLSLLLVRRLGLVGVALGTVVPIVLSNLFVVVPLACQRLTIPLRGLVRDALLKPLLCAAVCAGILTAMATASPAATWGVAIVKFVLYCAAYLALVLAVRRPEEREEDASLLRRAVAPR
jgi:O-antigen/teichoic acid export membrane protein